MKIKGSAKKLTSKAVIIAAAVLGGLLLALRCWQSFALIDPATGFFTDHKNFTVLPSYILAVGLAVLVPLLAYLTPLSKAEYIAPAKRPLHALGCLALGAAIALDAVKPLFGQEKTRLTVVTALLGAAAAAALINCNTAFLTGRDSVRKVKILMVFPALWALAKTLSYFSYYTSYIKTSALLLAIFADVFLMIFLFEYGKKVTGLGGDGNSPSFLSSALVCAALQLSAAATGIAGLIKHTEFLYTPFALYRLAAVLFCLTGIALFLKNNVPDYVPKAAIETHPLEAAPEAPAAAEPASPAEPAAAEAPEAPAEAPEEPANDEA